MSALLFSQSRDAEIAWLDGQLVKQHLKSLTQGEDKMDVDTFDSVPVLEQMPLTEVRFLLLLSSMVACLLQCFNSGVVRKLAIAS